MSEFISLRSTNRKIAQRQLIDAQVLQELKYKTTSIPGAGLQFIEEISALHEVAEIVASAERIRMMDKNGHHEFVAETRWTLTEAELSKNGIDMHSIDLPPGQIAALQMAKSWNAIRYLNTWGKGKGLERYPYHLTMGSSAVGLLTMPSSSPDDFFSGGRAMERIWLQATKMNIAFHPISIATLLFNTFLYGNPEQFSEETKKEIAVLRNRFEKVFSTSKSFGEILLFRIFISDKPEKKSLRVPVHKVLSFGKNEK